MSSLGSISSARTRFGGSAFNASELYQHVFSSPGAVQAVGTFGVGVNYRITSNFSMGLKRCDAHQPSGGAFAPWPLGLSLESQRRAYVQPDRPA